MRKLTTKRIQTWCKTNLKSEEEKKRQLKIHSKTEKEYRRIKYFLYDLENASGSRWIALETDYSQFQDWEIQLLTALKNYFDLMDSFLSYDSRYYLDHKSIESQKEFLNDIAEEQIDFLYSRCHKGSELVNKKIEYFNRVLKLIEKFNRNRAGE